MREIYIWEENHIFDCANNNLIQNKDVLEVGGALPEKYVKDFYYKSWTCLDFSYRDFEGENNFKIIPADVSKVKLEENSYDTIISTNCFEHVNGLKQAFLNMYNFLRPGGYLSALFGPIWSCHNGHHIWIKDGLDVYTFNNEVIPPFGHLIYSETQLVNIIKNKIPENLIDETINQVYYDTGINRLFYEDYIELINSSDFIIHEIRNWHKQVKPDDEIQKILEEKYPGKSNFQTQSLKILLQKPFE